MATLRFPESGKARGVKVRPCGTLKLAPAGEQGWGFQTINSYFSSIIQNIGKPWIFPYLYLFRINKSKPCTYTLTGVSTSTIQLNQLWLSHIRSSADWIIFYFQLFRLNSLVAGSLTGNLFYCCPQQMEELNISILDIETLITNTSHYSFTQEVKKSKLCISNPSTFAD